MDTDEKRRGGFHKLVVYVADAAFGGDRVKARQFIHGILQFIVKQMLDEKVFDRLVLPQFGVFRLKPRKARKSRSVFDKGWIEFPAFTTLAFKPSKYLRREENSEV